jgi:hypothetical protein
MGAELGIEALYSSSDHSGYDLFGDKADGNRHRTTAIYVRARGWQRMMLVIELPLGESPDG